jgi:hypothetical protein
MLSAEQSDNTASKLRKDNDYDCLDCLISLVRGQVFTDSISFEAKVESALQSFRTEIPSSSNLRRRTHLSASATSVKIDNGVADTE